MVTMCLGTLHCSVILSRFGLATIRTPQENLTIVKRTTCSSLTAITLFIKPNPIRTIRHTFMSSKTRNNFSRKTFTVVAIIYMPRKSMAVYHATTSMHGSNKKLIGAATLWIITQRVPLDSPNTPTHMNFPQWLACHSRIVETDVFIVRPGRKHIIDGWV